MAKLKKDELFELIIRLDKNEKQFYLKYAELFNQKSNYSLFKYLSNQSYYDSNKLKKDLQNESFVEHLSVQKNKLYNSILKAMRLHHSERDGAYKLWATLADFTFLQDKDLQGQIQKRLPKVKQYAQSQHQLYPLLKLISIERDIHSSKGYKNTDPNFMSNIDQSFKLVLKDLELIWRYRVLASEISQVYTNHSLHTPDQLKDALTQFFDQYNFTEDDVPAHPYVRQYYYQVYLHYHLYNKNYKEAFKYIFQQLKCVQELKIDNTKQIKNHAIIAINAIGIAFKANASSSLVWKLITDLYTLFEKHEFLAQHELLLPEMWFHELVHYIHQKELIKANKRIAYIKRWYKTNNLTIPPKLTLAFAGYHFTCLEFQAAADCIYKVKSIPRKQVNEQYLFNAYLLDLLLSVELNQSFLADSHINALERFLQQRKLNQTTIRSIVSMLKKINNVDTQLKPEERLEIYTKFKSTTDLTTINADIFIVDFEDWLEQKILSYSTPPTINLEL